MAYLKILVRKQNLKACTDYAADLNKTVEDVTNYALNTEKTEKRMYASCLNCLSLETAAEDMLKTKKSFYKNDKVLCYHLIQSFPPDEGTPELIHEIGVAFAKECFHDFEVVIGTHLDKGHLHNHIVVNSVSVANGRKYRSTPKSFYQLKEVSDRLCRENGLSVITPKGRGSHYAEWKAEKSGKTTIRSLIRKDIDAAIERSFTYKSFLDTMKKSGYAIKYGANVKHTAVKPLGSPRYFRLNSLGKGYTEDDIRQRLLERQQKGYFLPAVSKKKYRKARLKGNYQKSRKLTGLQALYWWYLYLLGKAKKRSAPKKVSPYLNEDVIRFEKYVSQNRFLHENQISTIQDLISMKSFFDGEIDRLTAERKKLYYELKKKGEDHKQNEAYQTYNTEIRDFRWKVHQCENIMESTERIQTVFQKTISETEKGGMTYEPRERSSGTNDKGNPADHRNSGKADSGGR